MGKELSPLSRVGHLNLNGDYSKLLPATLDEGERGGVLLRIPYLIGRFPEGWFWNDLGLHIGEDNKPLSPEPPPINLDYFDETGTVGLIGCRPAKGSSMRFGGLAASSGVGALSASYAVERAKRANNYIKINGLRSEIDGLSQWLNVWAHRTVIMPPRNGNPGTVSTTLELPPDLKLGHRLNLSATVIGTAPGAQQPEVRYTSTAKLQTYSTTPRGWEEHLSLHRMIRDLLRIAVWQPLTFQEHEVTSDSEKIILKEGEAPRSRWCTVKTAHTEIAEPIWDSNFSPLFMFSDLKSSGITRWLKLKEKNNRGLSPFLRLLDIRQGTIDEHITQLGIAMEALGYQAFLDSGSSEKSADSKSLEQRVRKIASTVAACMPNIPTSYPKDFADGYNAVKHANRPEPNPQDLIQHYRLGVKILRVWIALQLGLPEQVIRERLSQLP